MNNSAGHDIVVIGGSAGAHEPLTRLVHSLPADLSAALFVVVHMPARGDSMLQRILDRPGGPHALFAVDQRKVEPGHVYIAPPDRHLLVRNDRMRLSRGPHENRLRPAVDPLFRSAAVAYGPRVVGMILSGSLEDGAAGLQAVERCGGLTVVQSPEGAMASGMPSAAIAAVQKVWAVVPAGELPATLRKALGTRAGRRVKVPADLQAEDEALERTLMNHPGPELGKVADMSCPECGGPLRVMGDGERFRCEVGHAYNGGILADDQRAAVERALWAAIRQLEEHVRLLSKLSKNERLGRRTLASFKERAHEAQKNARLIRKLLVAPKE